MRNPAIESLRVWCFLAVIFIHVDALGVFGRYTTLGFVADELSRFAVPVFFILAGLFIKNEMIENPLKSVWAILVRLVPAYVFWAALYLVLDRTELLYPASWKGALSSYVTLPISGGPGYHLWFIPAYIMGMAICLYAIRYLSRYVYTSIIAAIYVIGVLIGCYQELFNINTPIVVYRNGLFFAPALILTGYLITKYQIRMSFVASAAMAIAGAAVHVAEGAIFSATYPKGHDFSFGTYFFALGLVLNRMSVHTNPSIVSGWGKLVFGAYLIHLLILNILVEYLNVTGIWPSFLVAFITFGLSILASKFLNGNKFTKAIVGA